jgi:hypothetical protein
VILRWTEQLRCSVTKLRYSVTVDQQIGPKLTLTQILLMFICTRARVTKHSNSGGRGKQGRLPHGAREAYEGESWSLAPHAPSATLRDGPPRSLRSERGPRERSSRATARHRPHRELLTQEGFGFLEAKGRPLLKRIPIRRRPPGGPSSGGIVASA